LPHDYAMRVRRLEQAEALLASEQEALDEARRRFEAERAATAASLQAEHEDRSEQLARHGAALDRRDKSLRQRGEQLDARAKSLDDLRRELAAGQRETLEMRVAVQELWLSLSGRVAPATMLQSLAESRAKLAAQYRETGGEIGVAEKRLRDAGERLAEQMASLKDQRRAFQAWADERQTAIERQAARLVAREQELDAQDGRFCQQERAWSEQRLAFRGEIRRLLGELRVHERATSFAAQRMSGDTD
jgi:hypothetical protein